MLDGSPKLAAIDEEANHQIVPSDGFRKAKRVTHKTLDPDAQIDRLALALLRVLFADCVRCRGDMALVGLHPTV